MNFFQKTEGETIFVMKILINKLIMFDFIIIRLLV